MSGNTNYTGIYSFLSGILMFFVLAWLTVSLPFVAQGKEANNIENSNPAGKTDDSPLTNTTEEKTPTQTSLSEEYIHHSEHDFSLIPFQISVAYLHAHESTYKAYHGEPPCPPPNPKS